MIPLCWKCCHKIDEPDVTGMSYRLIGCTECKKITDYNTAQMYCPITHPKVKKRTPKK
jgi:hypothetical protein